MNIAKDRIKKLVDEIPKTKGEEEIGYLLYLKDKEEQETLLTIEEEEEIFISKRRDGVNM